LDGRLLSAAGPRAQGLFSATVVRCALQIHLKSHRPRRARRWRMNCLLFTTIFNIFTTDLHFFTTPPSILTTHPSILTTLLCLLKSEICCYLGLGRHSAHKVKISGDALTVSEQNIFPSTTTVGTPYVRVICTGAASQSACRNVPSSHGRYLSLWASRWAVWGGQTQN
jgi:hypothetical protein